MYEDQQGGGDKGSYERRTPRQRSAELLPMMTDKPMSIAPHLPQSRLPATRTRANPNRRINPAQIDIYHQSTPPMALPNTPSTSMACCILYYPSSTFAPVRLP